MKVPIFLPYEYILNPFIVLIFSILVSHVFSKRMWIWRKNVNVKASESNTYRSLSMLFRKEEIISVNVLVFCNKNSQEFEDDKNMIGFRHSRKLQLRQPTVSLILLQWVINSDLYLSSLSTCKILLPVSKLRLKELLFLVVQFLVYVFYFDGTRCNV